jgi:transcriptional regulator with XRE-family HTH domain
MRVPPSLTVRYDVMVTLETNELIAMHTRARAATFPGSRQAQARPWSIASLLSSRFDHERATHPEAYTADPGTYDAFFYTTVYHSDFDPEWPITTDWPTVIRGLRGSFNVSQHDFAHMCKVGKASVERWETGRTIPLRGDALQLLSLIRPVLQTPLQAGQALNLAAAAVLPHLTKPTAEYMGTDLLKLLRSGKNDHSYLGAALISALVNARILVPLNFDDDALNDTYFPLAARRRVDHQSPDWASGLIDGMSALGSADRDLVLALVRRLAPRG